MITGWQCMFVHWMNDFQYLYMKRICRLQEFYKDTNISYINKPFNVKFKFRIITDLKYWLNTIRGKVHVKELHKVHTLQLQHNFVLGGKYK